MQSSYFYYIIFVYYLMFFFFSSRRRHTRWPRDWSSDVCSSDLGKLKPAPCVPAISVEPAVIQTWKLPAGGRRCCNAPVPAVVSGFSEPLAAPRDRKSTRLNSSHVAISYAVFCLKKQKKITALWQ